MSRPTIRPATPADAQSLSELRYEFRSPRAENKETKEQFLARCSRWMRERLASDSWRCWVAVKDGEIVGHAWLNFIEKIPNPVVDESEWHGYITNVYVRESARGGTGGALMDAAIAACKERDVDAIILWPTQKSRTLYARKGFSVNESVMSKENRPPHA